MQSYALHSDPMETLILVGARRTHPVIPILTSSSGTRCKARCEGRSKELRSGAASEYGDRQAGSRQQERLAAGPHCDAVVSHGGSGSVLGALAHGLPSVLIPLGADQPLNAVRCEALGVARVLDASTVTAESMREALLDVLENGAYRRRAEEIQAEIARLPDASHAIALLERLARE
jgi:hypothetical protein